MTTPFITTPPLCLLPNALAEMTAQAANLEQITLADRYGLLAAMMTDTLTEEERASVDRLLRAVRRGWMQVTGELSTLS